MLSSTSPAADLRPARPDQRLVEAQALDVLLAYHGILKVGPGQIGVVKGGSWSGENRAELATPLSYP